MTDQVLHPSVTMHATRDARPQLLLTYLLLKSESTKKNTLGLTFKISSLCFPDYHCEIINSRC